MAKSRSRAGGRRRHPPPPSPRNVVPQLAGPAVGLLAHHRPQNRAARTFCSCPPLRSSAPPLLRSSNILPLLSFPPLLFLLLYRSRRHHAVPALRPLRLLRRRCAAGRLQNPSTAAPDDSSTLRTSCVHKAVAQLQASHQ